MEEAVVIAARYKVSEPVALESLRAAVMREVELLNKAPQAKSRKQLKRNRLYRNFIKKMRKEIYYSLRQYYSTDDTTLSELKTEYREAVQKETNNG